MVHSEGDVAAQRSRILKYGEGAAILDIFDIGCVSFRQLKQAYLRLSLMIHPDHAAEEHRQSAEDCMKILTRSFTIAQQFCGSRLSQVPHDDINHVYLNFNLQLFYNDDDLDRHLEKEIARFDPAEEELEVDDDIDEESEMIGPTAWNGVQSMIDEISRRQGHSAVFDSDDDEDEEALIDDSWATKTTRNIHSSTAPRTSDDDEDAEGSSAYSCGGKKRRENFKCNDRHRQDEAARMKRISNHRYNHGEKGANDGVGDEVQGDDVDDRQHSGVDNEIDDVIGNRVDYELNDDVNDWLHDGVDDELDDSVDDDVDDGVDDAEMRRKKTRRRQLQR